MTFFEDIKIIFKKYEVKKCSEYLLVIQWLKITRISLENQSTFSLNGFMFKLHCTEVRKDTGYISKILLT